MANFMAVRKFKADSIREMCVRHNFYTRGDSKAYTELLDKELLKPTVSVMEKIAVDILKHSDAEGYNIESMMYVIEKECVETYFIHR